MKRRFWIDVLAASLLSIWAVGQIGLIGLKVAGATDVSWSEVTSPTWGFLLILLMALATVFVLVVFAMIFLTAVVLALRIVGKDRFE